MKKKSKVKHSKSSHRKKSARITSNGRVLFIGFFGGLFWSLIWIICYLLHFTKVGPTIFLFFLNEQKWVNKWQGYLLTLALLIAASIIIAFIYKYVLGKIKSIWISLCYGLFLYFFVFFIIEPWIKDLPPLFTLDFDTNTTMICLSLLYGLFIGYSISFDITSNAQQQNYSNK